MRIVQVSPSHGRLCGVAVFADSMATALTASGMEVRTVPSISRPCDADICLLQYHSELMTPDELNTTLSRAHAPVAVVAHSPMLDRALGRIAGVLAMAEGLFSDPASVPTLTFPHPAFAPEVLSNRVAIRQQFGLPADLPIVAASGFLRFDRRFPDILARLLPEAAEIGWGIQLVTSPWYMPSPGLLADLVRLHDQHDAQFWHVHEHLSEADLNRRLQAADLLWCWSPPPLMPYASGVISQMYGSGTQIVAADRPQHEHVLGLPNVVRAPGDLTSFVHELLRQMRSYKRTRHDPTVISWRQQIGRIAYFLADLLR